MDSCLLSHSWNSHRPSLSISRKLNRYPSSCPPSITCGGSQVLILSSLCARSSSGLRLCINTENFLWKSNRITVVSHPCVITKVKPDVTDVLLPRISSSADVLSRQVDAESSSLHPTPPGTHMAAPLVCLQTRLHLVAGGCGGVWTWPDATEVLQRRLNEREPHAPSQRLRLQAHSQLTGANETLMKLEWLMPAQQSCGNNSETQNKGSRYCGGKIIKA